VYNVKKDSYFNSYMPNGNNDHVDVLGETWILVLSDLRVAKMAVNGCLETD
jgi:hypothetical protein